MDIWTKLFGPKHRSKKADTAAEPDVERVEATKQAVYDDALKEFNAAVDKFYAERKKHVASS